MTSTLTRQPPAMTGLIGGVAWLLPGAGHFWLGYPGRGLLLGGSVWLLLGLGIALGGHFFVPSTGAELGPLAYFFSLFDLGAGLPYLIAVLTKTYISGLGYELAEQLRRSTSEYGNVCLITAGLLNYLNVLNACDLAGGQKS